MLLAGCATITKPNNQQYCQEQGLAIFVAMERYMTKIIKECMVLEYPYMDHCISRLDEKVEVKREEFRKELEGKGCKMR